MEEAGTSKQIMGEILPMTGPNIDENGKQKPNEDSLAGIPMDSEDDPGDQPYGLFFSIFSSIPDLSSRLWRRICSAAIPVDLRWQGKVILENRSRLVGVKTYRPETLPAAVTDITIRCLNLKHCSDDSCGYKIAKNKTATVLDPNLEAKETTVKLINARIR